MNYELCAFVALCLCNYFHAHLCFLFIMGVSSGAGRLFDAVSALTQVCPISNFHAEAPMRLEAAIKQGVNECYDFALGCVIKFDLMTKQIVEDIQNKFAIGIISAKFHNSIIELTVKTVLNLKIQTGINNVVLSGGIFQNKYLTERIENKLRFLDCNVFSHHCVPCNDGGIALGQLMIAAHRRLKK